MKSYHLTYTAIEGGVPFEGEIVIRAPDEETARRKCIEEAIDNGMTIKKINCMGTSRDGPGELLNS